jgi:hypothetical protein
MRCTLLQTYVIYRKIYWRQCLRRNSITYSMEKITSWKVYRFSTSQEISRILCKPHLQVPATCPYPEPARSVSYTTSDFLKIHLNIKVPFTPGSPKLSLSLRFSLQKPTYASPLSHTHYMHHPFHSSRFDHPNNIVWGVQVIQQLIM